MIHYSAIEHSGIMAYKLLFVCLGNICRSPSAENIMRYLVEQEGLSDQIICDSAATSDFNIGNPPDLRMKQAAQARNLKLEGESRQFDPSDFEKYDLILAMDSENYWSLISLDPQKKYRDKIKLICDYAQHYKEREVPDPYKWEDGFDYVIDILLDACWGVLEHLKQTNQIETVKS